VKGWKGRGKGKEGGLLVILEVETDAGEVDERLDTDFAELLWVTDAGALEDERRAQSTA
jgi:hypothetical protein